MIPKVSELNTNITQGDIYRNYKNESIYLIISTNEEIKKLIEANTEIKVFVLSSKNNYANNTITTVHPKDIVRFHGSITLSNS